MRWWQSVSFHQFYKSWSTWNRYLGIYQFNNDGSRGEGLKASYYYYEKCPTCSSCKMPIFGLLYVVVKIISVSTCHQIQFHDQSDALHCSNFWKKNSIFPHYMQKTMTYFGQISPNRTFLLIRRVRFEEIWSKYVVVFLVWRGKLWREIQIRKHFWIVVVEIINECLY